MLVGKFAMNVGLAIEVVLGILSALFSEEYLGGVSILALEVDGFEDLCASTVSELSNHLVFVNHSILFA